jgi:hypothetical protein
MTGIYSQYEHIKRLLFAAYTSFVPRKRTIIASIGQEHQTLCQLVMTAFLQRLEGELF